MLATLLFYGALAALAFWATREDGFRGVGAWLVVGFIISNVLWLTAPVSWRPGPYSAIEIMVAAQVYNALDKADGCTRVFAGLVLILGLNLVSLCANVGLAFVSPPTQRQVWLHEVTTNVCFGLECLLAAAVGVAHGYWSGRFARGHFLRRRVAAAGAQREPESQ